MCADSWGQVHTQVHAQIIACPSGILDVPSVRNGQCSVFDELQSANWQSEFYHSQHSFGDIRDNYLVK